MYYSSSSSSLDPFQYSTISASSFSSDPLPFSQFSGPFVDPQNLGLEIGDPEMNSELNISNKKKSKRSGKKDRHSKIYTAKGPRDRRMRLSVQIARKFFDLQDMLGFDKASKTIDWLLTKSKSAIKQVADNFQTTSVYSTSSNQSSQLMSGSCIKLVTTTTEREMNDSFPRQKKKTEKTKKLSSDKQLMYLKESRDMARARARERTKHKLNMIKTKPPNPNPSHLELSHAQKQDDTYLDETKSTWIFDLSHQNNNIVVSSDFEDHHTNNRYNSDIIKQSTTGEVHHLQNPNSSFIYQDQNLTSLVMATLDPTHPQHYFINLFSPSTSTPQNPISTNITTPNFHSHFTQNHLEIPYFKG